MPYRIRQIAPESKYCHQLSLDALHGFFGRERLLAIVEEEPTCAQRERRLNQVCTLIILIAQALLPSKNLRAVMASLLHPLRMLWPAESAESVPVGSALSYRRAQLGIRPLRQLFEQVCQPLASTPEQMPWAFAFGRRIMALDSTLEAVPDTPVNAVTFGYLSNGKGRCAYPLVRGIYLIECGTHAIIDAQFWPCAPNEQRGARLLLPKVGPGMLLTLDCGFRGYPFLADVLQTGADVLVRLPSEDQPEVLQVLSDGSALVHLRPADRRRRQQDPPLCLRLISYTITDPSLPGYGQTHRLLTSLLDPQQASALELICTYHERWEIEIVIDEIDTHQRLCQRTLRSRTPVGVIQELYGTLLAYYAVRALMLQAATLRGLDPDRLSFTHAVQVLTLLLPDFQRAQPADWPWLEHWLLDELGTVVLPERQMRSNPRVVKRRASKFKSKKPYQTLPPQPDKDTMWRDVFKLLPLHTASPPSHPLDALSQLEHVVLLI
jgi:Transposase DDE domain/Insertion element 4 transposase N-terminal